MRQGAFPASLLSLCGQHKSNVLPDSVVMMRATPSQHWNRDHD
jgi:hypothetical protein